MSSHKENEGIVIDVTPERQQSPPRKPTEKTAPARPAGKLPVVLALIALILVAAALGMGYRYWLNIKTDMTALDERLVSLIQAQDELRSGIEVAQELARSQQEQVAAQDSTLAEHGSYIEQQKAAFGKQVKRLSEERQLMEEREAELRSVVADVHRRVGGSGNEWVVAEAEYLMRLAGHRLALTGDVLTAQAALELADQRLKETADPGWNSVRDQLALEITALADVEIPDKAALSRQLAELAVQVPELVLNEASRRLHRRPSPQAEPLTDTERTWDTLVSDLLGGLKDSVTIRRNDAPVRDTLTPEHQAFLYQNLELQLETARLALARAEQGLFRQSLDNAGTWLKRFFDLQHPGTRGMLQSIGDLMTLELAPAPPDISASLKILETRKTLGAGFPAAAKDSPKS